MAKTFTITVTDEQGARAATAFGRWDVENPNQPAWIDATDEEIAALLKAFMKERAVQYEASKAHQDALATAQTEEW